MHLCAGKNVRFSDSWLAHVSLVALVLVRSGLSLNVNTIRSYGSSFFAFATIPTLIEALVGATIAMGIFDMPFLVRLLMPGLIAASSYDHFVILSSACSHDDVHDKRGWTCHYRSRLLGSKGQGIQTRHAAV